MDGEESKRSGRTRRVAPTEPDARAQLAAAELAEQPPTPEEGASGEAPPKPLNLRVEDEIAQDAAAVVKAILGGIRWLASRRKAEKAARYARAHEERDGRRALIVGRGVAKTVVRKAWAGLDSALEPIAFVADLVDEFATEAMREATRVTDATAKIVHFDQAGGQ